MAVGITFKTLEKIVFPIVKAKHPILIRGRHGIGKSEVVYQFANQLYFDENGEMQTLIGLSEESAKEKISSLKEKNINIGLKVVERRASQMTEGDLMGLPVSKENSTTWNPPDWFKEACDYPVVLFLDEIDRAVLEVRQGIFELTDSRKLNGCKLHPQTIIFAAVNGGNHGSMYQISEMEPAELDRWTTFDLEPSVEDWVEWARKKGNVHKYIIDFIIGNPKRLEFDGEHEPNKKYPSRRSWVRASSTLVASDLFSWEDKASLEQLDTILYITQGFIGTEIGFDFRDYCANIKGQVTLEEVLDKGKLDRVKDWEITEHSTFVDKIINSNLIESALTKKQLKNWAEYIAILPAEVAVHFFSVLTTQKTTSEIVQNNVFNLYSQNTKGERNIRTIISNHFVDQIASKEKSTSEGETNEKENG